MGKVQPGSGALYLVYCKTKEEKEMAKVGVVGAGSWGTALTLLLNKNGHCKCQALFYIVR